MRTPDNSTFIAPATDVEEIRDGWIEIPHEPDTEARYPGVGGLLIDRERSARDAELYFPVHPPCLGLFGLHMTGRQTSRRDFLGLDRNALWVALYRFKERCRNTLIFPYGFAHDCHDQLWGSRRGYEFLVANPELDWAAAAAAIDPNSASNNTVPSELRALIASQQGGTIATRNIIPPETATALSSKVKTDPFGNLPLELLHEITDRLDNGSLFALCSASWTAHSVLRTNNRFWRHRIQRVSMPWLIEVFPLLDDDDLMKEVEVKVLFCELDSVTKPRLGMRGPMMGVANRRRIWAACEVAGDVYAEAVVALPELRTSGKSLAASVRVFTQEEHWYTPPVAAEDKGEDALLYGSV